VSWRNKLLSKLEHLRTDTPSNRVQALNLIVDR